MHIPREYDNLIENDKKSEIVAITMEYFEALTGRKLPANFSDNITYKIKSGDTRQLSFSRNEGAQTQPILKKAGRTLKVEIASGLPKETDSTPQGLYQRASAPRGGSASQGGRGGRGGGGVPRGGGGVPRGGGGVPRGGGGAPRGEGAPRGGGATRGGGAPRGAPQGGGAAPRGRGAPQQGGAAPRGRGAPGGRGGAVRGRGGLPQPTQKPAGPTCSASFDYEAQTPDELSFNEGDTITIIQKDSGGWWEGEVNGKRGWIPANYVKEN